MKYIITDLPEGNRWNSIDNLIQQEHVYQILKTPSENGINVALNADKNFFIKWMFAIESLLNPILKEQCIYSGKTLFPIPDVSTYSFATDIVRNSSEINHTKLLHEDYKELPALKAMLPCAITAYYKENHLIIITKRIIDWNELFIILGFRYELISRHYKNTPFDLDVAAFYKALVHQNISGANQAINKILNNPVIQNLYYAKFKSYFINDNKHEIETLNHRIQDRQSNINGLLRQYTEQLEQLEKTKQRLEALHNRPIEDNSEECIKYLSKNPYISELYKESDRAIRIYFKSPILYYDDSIIATLKNNTSNSVYHAIYKIFEEKRYQLWTRCCLIFDTTNFSIQPYQIGSSGILRHPHIDRYRCLGNHPSEIRAWFEKKDYVGALTQITAATLNLNFYDSTVVYEMLYMLEHSQNLKTFLDTKTNQWLSLYEIINKGE